MKTKKQHLTIINKVVTSIFLFAVVLSVKAKSIEASDGYIRESIPGTTISSAYMTIANDNDTSVTLVGASSDFSPRIEIHEHTMANGMMSMRQVDSIVIDSKESVVLQPSGLHLMIFEVNKPLSSGDIMKVTLHFASQPDVEIELPVKGIKRKKHH